ncbi:MAG TPA: hypothetical protein DEA08_30880 [Planctomycetes bacterium]|nr:hypothetical protein [Planctomycetota bacterium]
MRKEDTLALDTHFLVRRLEVRGLKQGWVADKLGVARKTVSRWVTGKVKRIGRESADALAELLECPLERLTVSDEADVLATKEEQRRAASLIQQRDLLELLSPSDDWALAESCIKASLQPDLPLRELGRLYNLLSTAAWRQGNYDEGERHAARAAEIGEQIGDRRVSVGAIYNRAVIDSIRGDLGGVLAAYEACLAEPEAFETRREHAKVLSNVGDAYRSFLRFEESIAAQAAAIALFEQLGLELNLAIAQVSLGVVCAEAGRLEQAAQAYAQGAEHAQRAGYRRGVDCAPIYRADPLSLAGEREAARDLVVAALPGLARHAVYDLGCHQIAARVLRRAGDLEGARAQLDEGLRRAADFPPLLGEMHAEEARWARASADEGAEQRAREAANAAFSAAGREVRCSTGAAEEHGVGGPVERG